MKLREPTAADVAAITGLLEQLGYVAEPEQVKSRLGRLTQDANALVLIAERDGRLVGVVAGYVVPLLERDHGSCRLTALVVDEAERGRGIGAKLDAALESWARERGAFRIELTSSERRSGAHAFYEAVGYSEQSKRFVKTLDCTPNVPDYPL